MGAIGDVVGLLEKIPLWKTLKSLPEKVAALEDRVAKLERATAGGVGDRCPGCGKLTYFLASSTPDPMFGEMGGRRQTLCCSSCNFKDTILAKWADPDIIFRRKEHICKLTTTICTMAPR